MADTLTLALRSARPRRRLAVASWIPLALLGVIVLAVLFDLIFYTVQRLTTSRGIR